MQTKQLIHLIALFSIYLVLLILNYNTEKESLKLFCYIFITSIICLYSLYGILFKPYRQNKIKGTTNISNAEYTNNKNLTTTTELNKLFQNSKFINLMQQRGNNPNQWCWQAQEKNTSEDVINS